MNGHRKIARWGLVLLVVLGWCVVPLWADDTDDTDAPREGVVRLVAVGDVMLGRSVNSAMLNRTDWIYPFRETGAFLREADVALGNLESPFGKSCPRQDDGMIFCADRRSIAGLVFAGFDILGLENNHNTNQGADGLAATAEWLVYHGIAAARWGEVEILERNGLKIGFVAADDVSRRVDQDALVALIALADTLADVVVVSIHWGYEYQATPTARQVTLGYLMIDSGADLVIGHHPHWIQTVEEYNGGVIAYSLGNFVFDQMWSFETRRGAVGEFILTRDGVQHYSLHEVMIYDYSQPRWMP